jgi:hypothetical protein
MLDDEIPDRDRIDAILVESRDARSWRRSVDKWRTEKDAQLERLEEALFGVILQGAQILDEVRRATETASEAARDAADAERAVVRGSQTEEKLATALEQQAKTITGLVTVGHDEQIEARRTRREAWVRIVNGALKVIVPSEKIVATAAAGALALWISMKAKGCYP